MLIDTLDRELLVAVAGECHDDTPHHTLSSTDSTVSSKASLHALADGVFDIPLLSDNT